jgi:chorismate mutase/prephenate dehydratase
MDLLLATPLKICGEVVLRIHQNLLTHETDLGKITKVYSHAQSLAQCHEWLNHNLPGVPRISVASNSQAAQMAASEPGTAAIAGEAAAEHYKLPKLVGISKTSRTIRRAFWFSASMMPVFPVATRLR